MHSRYRYMQNSIKASSYFFWNNFNIFRSDLEGRGFGPFAVAEVRNFQFALKDGAKIATKVL